MIRWMGVAISLAGIKMEEGDLFRMFVSMSLGIFIVSLVWSVSSGPRSRPPS